MKRTLWRRVIAITVPAATLATVLMMVGIEVWVRATWDARQGEPGFYVADARRGQKLGAGYDGWFAGVPVKINQLGFRDDREYTLAKGPRTFRILVLGDSVTFGHGSVFERTYPYLLEQQLRDWRPEVDWQVWNLGVPGYNTRQEWAYLTDVVAAYVPDLVIVGFFPNDVTDNKTLPPATAWTRTRSRVLSWVRTHWYSVEWYRGAYLTLRWQVTASAGEQQRLTALGGEDRPMPDGEAVADAEAQKLTPFETLTADQVSAITCPSGSRPGTEGADNLQREASWPDFVDAVRALQAMHASGAVRLVFFLNTAPPVCLDGDVFYDGGYSHVNNLFLDVMGRGVPAISSFGAFLPLRPSQMPNAGGHSLGNANAIKASVLSAYLRTSVLPPLLTEKAP